MGRFGIGIAILLMIPPNRIIGTAPTEKCTMVCVIFVVNGGNAGTVTFARISRPRTLGS